VLRTVGWVFGELTIHGAAQNRREDTSSSKQHPRRAEFFALPD